MLPLAYRILFDGNEIKPEGIIPVTTSRKVETVLKLQKMVKSAINMYNRYRSPEATATLLEVETERLLIHFSGSFCLTCGIRDYFEDMKYELLDAGVRSEIVDVQDYGLEYIVKYRIGD